jgi:tRNA (uracil-5-)-methyltransferase TRM9
MNDEQIFLRSKQVWEENLKLFPQTKLNYPDENLARLFSGRYVPVPQPPARAMDHGFGTANTLAFLANKGYECAGCEISEHFINEAQQLFKTMRKIVDLRPVKGLEIPFDDKSFDVVVSWNVIHYNGTRTAVMKVISELCRVLEPGGVLLLSTLHPDSSLFSRMRHLGDGSYLIEKESEHDNRQGLTFFCSQSAEELAGLFCEFSEVKIGSASSDLFNLARRNAWFLVYAIR